MGPLLFGLAGFGLGWLFASSRREERERVPTLRVFPPGGCFPGDDPRFSSQYGAVTPWMGGRGAQAGSGAASQMGGRTVHPYAYDSPSSVVTNWNSGAVFGFHPPARRHETDVDRLMAIPVGDGVRRDRYGFTIPVLNVPIGPASRAKHLSRQIQSAKAKLAQLEGEAGSARGDDAALDQLSLRIARVQNDLEQLQDKYDRVSVRASSAADDLGDSGSADGSDEDFGFDISFKFNEKKVLARRAKLLDALDSEEPGSSRHTRLRKAIARIEKRLERRGVDFDDSANADDEDEDFGLFSASYGFNEDRLLAKRAGLKREIRALEPGARRARLRRQLARLEERLENHDVDFGFEGGEVSLFRHRIHL